MCEALSLCTIPSPRTQAQHCACGELLTLELEFTDGVCVDCLAEAAGFQMPEPQTETHLTRAQIEVPATESKILDGNIAGKSWFALDRLTLADIALGPIVARCLDFPIEKPAYADLSRWMKSIAARPAFMVATGASRAR